MKTRKLGSSDLEVTEISLGSWLTYSGGVGREQSEACTKAAFDAGINFFDTSNAYGRGADQWWDRHFVDGAHPVGGWPDADDLDLRMDETASIHLHG